MCKLVYKPLEPLSKLEIQEWLERGKEDELVLLPLSVGELGEGRAISVSKNIVAQVLGGFYNKLYI